MNKLLKHWPAYSMGLLIAIIFIAASITFQVAENENAVVIRLGEPLTTRYEPGLHFKWFYPIDRVWKEDKRLRTFSGTAGRLEETQTADGKNVMVEISVIWNIQDSILFIQSLKTIDNAEKELNSLMRSAKNAVLSKFRLDQLINVDSDKVKTADFEMAMRQQIMEQAKEYGIAVQNVGLQHLGFPQEVASSVFDRMRAERNRLSERYLGEGQGEAAKIKALADSKAGEIMTKAEAEATMIRAEGDAAAAKFYAAFKKSPELATFLRKLKALKKTVDGSTTVILDTKSAPFDLFEGDLNLPVKSTPKSKE